MAAVVGCDPRVPNGSHAGGLVLGVVVKGIVGPLRGGVWGDVLGILEALLPDEVKVVFTDPLAPTQG